MGNITCTMEYPIHEDGRPLHFVKDQIVVNHQHSIAQGNQVRIERNRAGEWMDGEALQARFNAFERFSSGTRILSGQIGNQLRQILLGDAEQVNAIFT